MTGLEVRLVVGTDWQNGVANYRYFDGQRWHEVNGVPAQQVESVSSRVQLPPLEPGPVILPHPPIMPLYAAPIQSAIASGDLAQMKNLASQAKQQLDQHPQLQSALEAAKGEISRLERR
jgi:hypothetical protein